ncbi:UNVERIFIED_CONTAM: hypothetical protein NCL1_18512 [Trichonephila clavipes]
MDGMKKWIERLNKYVAVSGSYVELFEIQKVSNAKRKRQKKLCDVFGDVIVTARTCQKWRVEVFFMWFFFKR